MKKLSFAQVSAMLGGKLLCGDKEAVLHRIHTDTRSIEAGDCFIALCGEHYDGHLFLKEAAQAGAVCAVVSKEVGNAPEGLALIRVDDTLKALQEVAKNYRKMFSGKIIGVVGSNGKTTTKEILSQILRSRFKNSATEKNYNNHIGVPLTLLKISEEEEFVVVEMGTNHPGEISCLAEITQPDAVILTNIGREHLEFFGDESGVAQEEGCAVEFVGEDGVVILNADDKWTEEISKRAKCKVVLAGRAACASWSAEGIQRESLGRIGFVLSCGEKKEKVVMPLMSRDLINNVLLAAAAAAEVAKMGIEEIAQALLEIKLPQGRMEFIPMGRGGIINDCYNSNPDSVKIALGALSEIETSGKKYAVLGYMGDLGKEAEGAHLEMGRGAAKSGVDYLGCVGKYSERVAMAAVEQGMEKGRVRVFRKAKEAAQWLKECYKEEDVLLLKGSRSVALEEIIEAMKQEKEVLCSTT